jgi:hypothetical protein
MPRAMAGLSGLDDLGAGVGKRAAVEMSECTIRIMRQSYDASLSINYAFPNAVNN